MDFGPWGTPANMDQIDSTQQQNSGASGNHPSVPEGGQYQHQLEHVGVVCDVCDAAIRGFRYKCLQCANYDLCSVCERRGLHAGHTMLRIAFPEQAAEAIKRYFNAPSPISSPRPRFHVHGIPQPPCGLARPPVFGRPFDFGGRHHGKGKGSGEKSSHHQKKKHGRHSSSSESEDDKVNNSQPDCPYLSGGDKRHMKKWAKKMRKAQQHLRRSAEAYAQAAATGETLATASAASGTGTGTSGTAENRQGFDFSAAAAQIQEFLNAVGIPIDVVDFYEELNKPTDSSKTGSKQATSGANVESNTSSSQQQPSGLADQLQNLNIGNVDSGLAAFNSLAREDQVSGNGGNNTTNKKVSFSTNGMDTEVDTEWTLLDADKTNTGVNRTSEPNDDGIRISAPDDGIRVTASDDGIRVSAVADGASNNAPATAEPSPPLVDISETTASSMEQQSIPINVTMNVHGVPNQASNNNNAPNGNGTTPSAPLYPQLPNILDPQRMMNNISNAVGSALKNIPMVANPQNPFAPRQPPPTTNTVNPPPPRQDIPQAQLDARSTLTLNQLLSMGFSNHDGWLARLVASKGGDLDAVLSALFPAGQ